MAADLHYLSLGEVARRLKARELSSVDATQAVLDRIARLDPALKSYATVSGERALADAARCDAEAAAGGALGGASIANSGTTVVCGGGRIRSGGGGGGALG